MLHMLYSPGVEVKGQIQETEQGVRIRGSGGSFLKVVAAQSRASRYDNTDTCYDVRMKVMWSPLPLPPIVNQKPKNQSREHMDVAAHRALSPLSAPSGASAPLWLGQSVQPGLSNTPHQIGRASCRERV